MKYVLALDQGTTSSRAIVFDRAGLAVATAQQEFRQIFPQPGWVEHDANEIWASQRAVAQQALKQLGAVAGAGELAIGITNQRETTVLWDRATGQPVANAIVWQDRRTAARCDELRRQGKAGLIQKKTGLVIDAYFSATKLQWLLDNVPGARARAEPGRAGVRHHRQLADLEPDRGQGARHGRQQRVAHLLFNMHTLQWDDELLRLFNIPRSVLPQVVPSSGVLGTTDAALFRHGHPIAGVAGDQQAATFGQACFAPGMAKNTYGTGCFMLMNTGTAAVPSRNKLLTTVGWQGPPGPPARLYCLEGGVFMAGATIQWLRDGLQMIQSAPEVEALATLVPDTGDVYLVPAFAGLGAPDWDGYARGTLLGMTRGTTRAHIARAALEAIALQVADVFDAMARDSGIALKELRVDGGACSNNLLMQMQADFLGVPVVRPRVTETTALGAAYLAGLATGFWRGAAKSRRNGPGGPPV
jgi:glycerol kinase